MILKIPKISVKYLFEKVVCIKKLKNKFKKKLNF